MKRVLSCFLICALLGCCVLALASCSVKFSPKKSTDATTAAPGTTDPSASSDVVTGTQAGDATTVPADTEPQPTEPQPTEPPETTAPEEGISTGEDPDNNFGPVHNF